ncbi:MAG: SRPBCC family protein [Actinomycetota bacterium]|nr:SRPBCC family protein [Actinomycetota bacterium]
MSESLLTREISIVRKYSASPESIFGFLKDPLKVASWWGPDQFVADEVDVEPRIGGNYSLTMTGMGFSQRIIGAIVEFEEAKYLAVENRVEYEGSTILRSYFRITIEQDGDGTELTLKARATVVNEQMMAALQGMYAGWNQAMQRLDDCLFERIERTLVVLGGVASPVAEVFKYWSEPERLSQWWRPMGFRIGRGGEIAVTSPDDTLLVNQISFLEIDPPLRLGFRYGYNDVEDLGFNILVLLDEMGSQTVVSVRFVFDTVADYISTLSKFDVKKGAEGSLDRLRASISG